MTLFKSENKNQASHDGSAKKGFWSNAFGRSNDTCKGGQKDDRSEPKGFMDTLKTDASTVATHVAEHEIEKEIESHLDDKNDDPIAATSNWAKRMMDSAQQKAQSLQQSAQQKVQNLQDSAQQKMHNLEDDLES